MERYSTCKMWEQYILKGYELCCVRLWSFITLVPSIIRAAEKGDKFVRNEFEQPKAASGEGQCQRTCGLKYDGYITIIICVAFCATL